MDAFLGKVTAQAMNYAIRSGITITTTYAIRQCGRLLSEVPRGERREELMQLQLRLEGKIRIISPAIDMIELISARGNTSLESAVSLTKEIRFEIQRFGVRLSEAANEERLVQRESSRAKTREQMEAELDAIIRNIKKLLIKIEDAVPLINLAITTSGVNLSTKLSGTISPSRLMQASTFLTAADGNYSSHVTRREQVGPTYTLGMYMLFAGHAWRPADDEGIREMTWKEVIHKAKLKMFRVPLDALYDLPGENSSPGTNANETMHGDAHASEFAYQLVVVEDLDDDRVHTFEDHEPRPGPFEDVSSAGIRDVIPVHEISKVFYADTGKILNIGGESDSHNPVLLLRRDVHAEPPRRMLSQSQMDHTREYAASNGTYVDPTTELSEVDAQIHRESTPDLREAENEQGFSHSWRIPADLDPEWMAFEVYTEESDSESEADADEPSSPSRPTSSNNELSNTPSGITGALSNLTLRSSTTPHPPSPNPSTSNPALQTSPLKRISAPQIKTTLSLLEMLLKLTALQQFRQESHLAIEDELLNFFLEDSATAGAGPDRDYRQRLRHDAVRRVGFDPYDESPIKRRGEGYIRDARYSESPNRSPYSPTFNDHELVRSPRAIQDTTPSRPSQSYPATTSAATLADLPYPSIEPSLAHRSPTTSNSTPPPRPPYLGQPPTPPHRPSGGPRTASETHRSQIAAKYSSPTQPAPPKASNSGGRSSLSTSLATPPSSAAARSRQALLRAQSESKAGSPLSRELEGGNGRGEGAVGDHGNRAGE